MKKEYKKIWIQFIEFPVADVIVMSNPGDDMLEDDIIW